jgi:hypothetical protein
MCIIIDNNVAHRVLKDRSDRDFATLTAAIFGTSKQIVKVVYGGGLRREYTRSRELVRVLVALDRAGRARKVADDLVDAEEAVVAATGICVSDDPHIIALARVADVRLVCSHDRALHADFTNPRLTDRPRGHVYQNASHDHLLKRMC